jgi:hypothetical protein
MKIKIDFAQNKSLGNVYNKDVPNNFDSFETAQKLYNKHKIDLDNYIIETMNMGLPKANAGASVTVPTVVFQDSGFITSLTFHVISRTEEEAILALTNVGH